MDTFSIVTSVVGVATKKDGTEIRGNGKKGPWTMFTVILENGIKLNVFGPVKEGDTVYDLEQDEQYHSWKGKVKAAGSSLYPSTPQPQSNVPDMSQPTNAQVLDALRALYKHVDERFEVVENMIAGLELTPTTKNAVATETTVSKPDAGKGPNRDPQAEMNAFIADNGGEPIDLDEIPF